MSKQDAVTIVSSIIGQDLPHIEQYAGPWAMLPRAFSSALQHVRTSELLATHVRRHEQRVEASGKVGLPAMQSAERRGDLHSWYLAGDVAVVELRGVMTKYGSSMSDLSHGTLGVRRALRQAIADSDVESILLVIDSPGGSALGTADLGADVAEAAKQKRITAYIEDMGASAAYWVASQATSVQANDGAVVGSIGTYLVIDDWSSFYADHGVKTHVVRAGRFKGAGVEGTEITDEQLAEFQREVNEINEGFLRAVARGRNLTSARVRELADGRAHVGAASVTEGLVDEIASLDQALSQLQESNPTRRGTKQENAMSEQNRSRAQAAADERPAEEQTTPQNEAPNNQADQQPDDEAAAGADTPADEAVDKTSEPAVAPESTTAEPRQAEGERFIAAFGEKGAVWYAQGKSFDQAKDLYIEELRQENAQLHTQLSAARAASGESEPAEFSEAQTSKQKQQAKLKQNLGDGLAEFASTVRLPSRN